MLPCPIITTNGKLITTTQSRQNDINSPNTSGMKIWVTSPGKESRPAEILAESEGNTESVLIQGSYK